MRISALLLFFCGLAMAVDRVPQSPRQIPVAYDVDVVVLGGSTGAVAAAVHAAQAGAKVFLAAPKTYLGEDMCATMRLWLEAGEDPKHPLARRIFSDWDAPTVSRDPVRPLHVKKTLDEALLAAKVPYLFSSYATDVLRGPAGELAGVVIANRAGRQAVRAKVIIDATSRAWVARLAGAKFQPYASGVHEFRRYVVGGPVKAGGKPLPLEYRGDGSLKMHAAEREKGLPVIEYRLRIPMKDGSYASFAAAEQTARDLTFDPAQRAASDEMFELPPDAVKSQKHQRKGSAQMDLGALRPAGLKGLYVLGGNADVPRSQVESLLRPPALIELGARVGEAAAKEAAAIRKPATASVAAGPRVEGRGDVRELLEGERAIPMGPAKTESPLGGLPVLGSYDVVVVGGGTGGAPAAIAAGRAGAKTLVVEYLSGLGGVGTMGMISIYYWGYRGGFTKEVPGTGTGKPGDNPRFTWDPLERSNWYRTQIRQGGGEIWFGAMGAGTYMEGNHVRGVVVATPQGRGVVLAKAVIDATGNADVAKAAGAQTIETGSSEIAVQGTGLPSINLSQKYTNTDFTITDDSDMADVWHTMVYAKNKHSAQFDIGQLIDSRERRRIVGDFEMGILDQMLGRHYPDTIAVSFSNFDTHGYTVHPYFLVDHPEKKGITVDIPYRCLLPKGIEGMLTIGLGISVHRDAVPLVRMQPDIQNHGYAAGLAAATAAKTGTTPRGIDLKQLQKRLVELEIVPPRVLSDADNFPISDEKLQLAIVGYPQDHRLAAALLSRPESASPALRAAYRNATSEKDKLEYAMMLAALGDATGAQTIVAAVEASKWDAGWRYVGMGQFGSALSTVDQYLVLLGKTRDRQALDAIIRKAAELTPDAEFSHYRAVALALEGIGDARAADTLAALLSKPEVRGYAIKTVERARELSGLNVNETHTRAFALRELALARALYRCGDKQGLGRKVLEEYTTDLRGHLAKHALAVLKER